jgi:hypothetical protein
LLLAQRQPFCTKTNPTSNKGTSELDSKKMHTTFRYPLPWTDPDFYDKQKLEQVLNEVWI